MTEIPHSPSESEQLMMTFPERDDSHVDAKFFEGPHDYADFARNALANPDMAEALKNLKAANRARRQQSK